MDKLEKVMPFTDIGITVNSYSLLLITYLTGNCTKLIEGLTTVHIEEKPLTSDI